MRALGRGVLLACTLAACGHNIHARQRATARAIIPTPHPDSVTISDVRGPIGLPRRWVALTTSGVYDCSIEARGRAADLREAQPAALTFDRRTRSADPMNCRQVTPLSRIVQPNALEPVEGHRR